MARLAGRERLGRYFGRYGAWKSTGYVLGPVLGILLVQGVSLQALYVVLAVLAAGAALWVALSMPALPVQPRRRTTVVDLVRQTTDRAFLVPTALLATTTGVLGVAVGFVPLLAVRLDLPAVVGAVAIAAIAVVSSALQPLTGRFARQGRLATRGGSTAGLLVAAAGLAVLAAVPAR